MSHQSSGFPESIDLGQNIVLRAPALICACTQQMGPKTYVKHICWMLMMKKKAIYNSFAQSVHSTSASSEKH